MINKKIKIKRIVTYSIILSSCLSAAAIAATWNPPRTYVYYDENGSVVGEQPTGYGCNESNGWGIRTDSYTIRSGCGVSM